LSFSLIRRKIVRRCKMTYAIKIHTTGGPDVLSWEEHDPGVPGPGEARVVHEAVGLNFIDVYHRTGLYPLPALPAVLGLEGAGIVDMVGEGVTEFVKGDRVAYAGVPPGAYSEIRCIPAHRLVKLPEAISSHDAAGMMLQGMTARYLLRGCFNVRPESTILIHDASGGVGSILCQWANHIGATTIGTVGRKDL
jgi:NADPH2:quinone reductase